MLEAVFMEDYTKSVLLFYMYIVCLYHIISKEGFVVNENKEELNLEGV